MCIGRTEPDLFVSTGFGHDCWRTCVHCCSPLICSQTVMLSIDVLLLATSNCHEVVEEGRSIPHKAPQQSLFTPEDFFPLITGPLQGVLPSLSELTVGG